MPKLFCPECAKIKTSEAIKDIGKYPGEYTKIITGRLEKDSARCDECNMVIERGDPVHYFAFLSENIKDLRWEDDLLMKNDRKVKTYK